MTRSRRWCDAAADARSGAGAAATLHPSFARYSALRPSPIRFDPADRAVALAQKRAEELKAKSDTAIALDTEFDVGRGQRDLILDSWSHPAASATKAEDATLRPGAHQPCDPAAPLTGPTISGVSQPP